MNLSGCTFSWLAELIIRRIYLPPFYCPSGAVQFTFKLNLPPIALLEQCKWICEAVFESLLAKFYCQSDRPENA